MRILVAGATGFIGRALVPALVADGHEVVSLARDPARAERLRSAGSEIAVADLATDADLSQAMRGVEVAYFLVHMIGTFDDYGAVETAAARRFGEAATAAGVDRVVYLGGLGDPSVSPHLRSRHETALALQETGPSLTYFRAAMVIGAGSESFRLIRSIVERSPAVPDKEWIRHRSQPIGARDVIRYLRLAPLVESSKGREVQIGGPEVLTHLDMIDAMARELGASRRRRLRIPGASPGAVAAAAAIVTKGKDTLAAELTLSLVTDTVVTDPEPARDFPVTPEPVNVAIQRALEEDEERAA